jgi:hypothetical protein
MNKIRIALLTGATVLGLSVTSVRAEVPVIDVSSIAQQLQAYIQDLKNYAVYLQQLQAVVQQVQWATSTFNSLVQNPNLGAAMALMNELGVSDPLPINPGAITGLINGSGGDQRLPWKPVEPGELVMGHQPRLLADRWVMEQPTAHCQWQRHCWCTGHRAASLPADGAALLGHWRAAAEPGNGDDTSTA